MNKLTSTLFMIISSFPIFIIQNFLRENEFTGYNKQYDLFPWIIIAFAIINLVSGIINEQRNKQK